MEANPKWKRFMREPGIHFHAVPRATTYLNEPGDEAIMSAMAMIQSNIDARIGLLTSDAGFIGSAVDMQKKGKRVVVLIPQQRIPVLKKYEDAGLQVVRLESDEAAPKVRAILHEDGSGSVHMAEAYDALTQSPPTEEVKAFLDNSVFKGQGGYLIQKCAKFHFENCTGSIPVYPPQLATIAVHDVMHAKATPPKPCSQHLAFFIPVSAPGGGKKRNLETFGSARARSVWRGEGPFMKYDSPTLVAEVLENLGYIEGNVDDADLREPLFCFINRAGNKLLLRQIGLLPESGEARTDITRKLRAAFCSNDSSGFWQISSKLDSFGEMQQIAQILKKAGLLADVDSYNHSREEIFAAMKVYGQKHGLPMMRTFEALALQIRHFHDMNPTRRQLIEIE
eukprot:Skav213421  [mRNA]  locus=scaffold38:222768:223952:- [translate_table: standard]